MTALDALTDGQLDDTGFTDPFGNEVTRRDISNLMVVHRNYHAGQLALSRRLAGLPGVIRAADPEQAEA